MMRLTRYLSLLTLLLLCACATQQKAEKYFDKNPDKLAAYVDRNEDFKKQYGSRHAARHLPEKVHPPVVESKPIIVPGRLVPYPPPEQLPVWARRTVRVRCPDCESRTVIKTISIEDTARLEALRMDYTTERKAHEATQQQLKFTEAERNHYMELNRKKFWGLVAMGVFTVLFIVFRILASRVRTS
jgi:hypothetical protein